MKPSKVFALIYIAAIASLCGLIWHHGTSDQCPPMLWPVSVTVRVTMAVSWFSMVWCWICEQQTK